jgi:hypothetical protein
MLPSIVNSILQAHLQVYTNSYTDCVTLMQSDCSIGDGETPPIPSPSLAPITNCNYNYGSGTIMIPIMRLITHSDLQLLLHAL